MVSIEVCLGLSSEQQAMVDSVGGALASRGERTAAAVLAATMTLEHNQGDHYLGALQGVTTRLNASMPELMTLPGMVAGAAAVQHSTIQLEAHIALFEGLSSYEI